MSCALSACDTESSCPSSSTAPFAIHVRAQEVNIPDGWTLRREDSYDSEGGYLTVQSGGVFEIELSSASIRSTPVNDARIVWYISDSSEGSFLITYWINGRLLIECDLTSIGGVTGILSTRPESSDIKALLEEVVPRRFALFRQLINNE